MDKAKDDHSIDVEKFKSIGDQDYDFDPSRDIISDQSQYNLLFKSVQAQSPRKRRSGRLIYKD